MSLRFPLVAAGVLFAAALSVADDWPGFRGPTRDGICKETGLLQKWPEGGPKKVWTAEGLGLGWGTPSVADGKIFGIGTGGDAAEDRAALERTYPPLEEPLGEALLAVHRSYYEDLKPVLTRLHGIAHITGGGIIDNVPRVLPDGLAARFEAGSWRVPPLFTLIQEKGAVSDDDMYHTFNMGIGIVLIAAADEAAACGEIGSVGHGLDEEGDGGRVVAHSGVHLENPVAAGG